jgi:hypothetical protein
MQMLYGKVFAAVTVWPLTAGDKQEETDSIGWRDNV